MSKPKKKLETNNDFWNDCLKENKKPKKFLNTKINPSPNYLNRAKRNKNYIDMTQIKHVLAVK